MASVAGLAPARTSLKGWLRELLCIHGHKGRRKELRAQRCCSRADINAANSKSSVAISDKVVPEAGIAPASPRLQRGANLPQLLRVVVPRGNAPRSSGYQPGALLLSYETGK